MPLTNSARASLVTALRLRAGISDTDSRIRQPAILVRDDGSTNSTSSTVQVTDSAVVLVGDTSGTDTVAIGASTTLSTVVSGIDTAADGRSATLIAPDGDEASDNLALLDETSLLDGDVLLYVESEALLEALVDNALSVAEGMARTRLFDDGSDITHTVWRDDSVLTLDNRHVNVVSFFGVDEEDAFTVTYSGSGTATIAVTEDAVLLNTRAPSNSPVVTNIDLGSDSDVQDVVDSINGTADWSATLRNDGRADTLVRMPPQRVTTNPVSVERWVEGDGEYRLDPRAGVIHMDELLLDRYQHGQRTSGQVRVHYTAGFDPLPADLEGLIINAAKAGLDAMKQSGGVQSERLGDYSYTLAPDTSAVAAIESAVYEQRHTLIRYGRMLP